MVGYLLKASLAVVLLFSVSFSQEPERTEAQDYQVAYGLFADGQYQLALDELRLFAERHPDSPRIPDATYLSAECLMNDGKTREASRAFEGFIKRYPRHPLVADARFRLGELSYGAGKYEEAIGRFQMVVEGFPTNELAGEAAYWVGESYFKLKQFDRALTWYRLSAEKYPKNRVADYALYSVGWTLEQKKEYPEARKAYAEFAANHAASPLAPSARVRSGAVLIAAGEYDAAISALREAEKKVTNEDARGEAVFLVGEAEYKKGDNAAALVGYKEFLTRFPGHRLERDARYGIGWVYLREKNYPEASQAFAAIASGDDELADAAQYRRGQALKLGKNTAEGRKEFESLLARHPGGPYADNALLELGIMEFERKEYAAALDRFRKIIKDFPSSDVLAEAHRMSGECYLATKEFDQARSSFAAAAGIGSAPSDVRSDALFQEGWSLYRMGRYADAGAKFAALRVRYPEHPRLDEAIFWEAESEYKAERYREAYRAYGRLLEAFPSGPKTAEALYGRAWSAMKLGDHATAATLFEQTAQRFPAASFAFDARVRAGDAYFAKKSFDKAALAYRGAIKNPGKGETLDYPLFQLAQALIRSGAPEEGIKEYRNLITRYPSSEYRDDAEYAIGWTYFQQKEYGKAIAQFRALVERAPKSPLAPRALLSIGDARYNGKEIPSALSAYREVLAKYPSSKEVADALNGVEFCYGAQGNEAAAGSVIDEFVRANPSHPQADRFLFKRGELLFSKNDYANALEAFQSVADRYPKSPLVPEAKYWSSRSLAALGKKGEAITLLKGLTAGELRGDLAGQAVIDLGLLYGATGAHEEALALFEKAEGGSVGKETAMRAGFEKGVILKNAGETDRAFSQFNAVANAHPGTVYGDRGRIEAGRILLERGETARAKEAFTAVAGRHTDDVGAEAQYLVGEIAFRAGDYKQAVAALLRIKYLYPSATWWIARGALKMGESYEKMNEPAKAREAYQSVLRLAAAADLDREAERRLKELK